MTQKCKAISLLNDARDNALELFNYESDGVYLKEMDELEEAIKNPTAFAMDILRHEMKDKSEGELYHAWMCNIKFAVYDVLTSESHLKYDNPLNHIVLDGCEEGAKVFLDRLLKESD